MENSFMTIEAVDAGIRGYGFVHREHTQANTHRIQSLAEAMAANRSPLFQSIDPDIIHSPSVSVCLSPSLRCSEVCNIIHSSSLQSSPLPSNTHTHSHFSGQHFCLHFYHKIEGFGG